MIFVKCEEILIPNENFHITIQVNDQILQIRHRIMIFEAIWYVLNYLINSPSIFVLTVMSSLKGPIPGSVAAAILTV